MEIEMNGDKDLVDVEVLEFSLSGDEIEELIAKLQLLKTTKEPISFDIDDENELCINYEEAEETRK